MKKKILIALFFCSAGTMLGQQSQNGMSKPLIDTSILGNWPYLENPVISNNGLYVLYNIRNSRKNANSLVILNTNSSWKREFIIKDSWLHQAFFSFNNRLAIFINGDSLNFVTLGKNNVKVVNNVKTFKVPKTGDGKWVAYSLNTPADKVILSNLNIEAETVFTSVSDYYFSNNGRTLLLKRDSAHTLQLFDLEHRSIRTIWSSKESIVVDCVFDNQDGQLAFTVQSQQHDNTGNSIWYYKEGLNSAVERVSNKSSGIEDGLLVDGSPRFSENGRWIFFFLNKRSSPVKPKADKTMVDIWSFKDLVLQPEQTLHVNDAKRYFAVTPSQGGNVVRLQKEDERIVTYPNKITGEFTVIVDNDTNLEYWWTLSPQPSYYLVSLIDGTRRLLKRESKSLYKFSFSPQGRFLVYYDTEKKEYFNYDVTNSRTYSITQSIPTKLSAEYLRQVDQYPVSSVAGWETNEGSLLLYDNYDIWKIDPLNVISPVNITNSYGKKNKIMFRLVYGPTGGIVDDEIPLIYSKGELLLLTAFNTTNKYNGFYKKPLNESGDPSLLTMGPYTFYRAQSQKPHFFTFQDDGLKPIKARNSDAWIVRRESAMEAPNYFITNNFTRFKPLSSIQPQKEFNWLTAELVDWKMFDGEPSQVILYKPENFDSTKKYPVIFNYYEALSHRLYQFPYPRYTDANVDIPWFVSNGYLVFTPDIHYSIANLSNVTVGEHAYNSIVSAARHLSKLKYVDSTRMAIQGHSFGGMETNYIVTHTDLFAAAAEVAGISDNVSAYLTLAPVSGDLSFEDGKVQHLIERGHQLMGATMWERPDLYIKSSAVLSADKITTPLLISHNKRDNQIPWRQGVELYMALRRLGKKSWMLQYDNSGHGPDGSDAIDYTIRLTQFFDHYLKGKPAPLWMTKGIPAALKGIETGYELDNTGFCGRNCQICSSLQDNVTKVNHTP